MNSEELEQSLRTEFESYLKNVLAEMRQEVSGFQKQFDAEFDKHKAQIEEVFQNFSSRIAAEKELDISFTESVIEHLRLARDEGARITATAIAEAEELDKQNAFAESQNAAPTVSYSEIREAINDISTKTTQSAILKTLVHHAGQFTPRGAFFIIKNEHLVGWRVFGKEGETTDEHAVREVFFPVASSTILGQAVRSLSAVESAYGSYTDDSIYLNKLEFAAPDSMYAVPLVVRGRSVAALYADSGVEQGNVNVDALETLVRVASLTVEVLASSRGAQPHAEADETPAAYRGFDEPAKEPSYGAQTFAAPVAAFAEPAPAVEESPAYEEVAVPVTEPETVETAASFEQSYSYEAPAEESFRYQPIQQPSETFDDGGYETIEGNSFSFKPKADKLSESVETEAVVPSFSSEPAWSAPVETESYYSPEPEVEYEAPVYETAAPAVSNLAIPEPQASHDEFTPSVNTNEYEFESTPGYDAPKADFEVKPSFELPTYETPAYEAPTYEAPAVPAYEAPVFEAESYSPSNGVAFEPAPVVETVRTGAFVPDVPAAAETAMKAPTKSRFSERNVDLPIEVPEEERRHHNDARRFARLLVSEIKLYNEQKVKEGRDGNDLYDRLREAIDRSREMYDKRVQPPVAAKFDYFHYELVSNLAEGDEAKLGVTYPGANV